MFLFSSLYKKVQKMKNHKTPEDMLAYCPASDCTECNTPLCDRYGVVYEGCKCDECEAQREEMRKLRSRYCRI